jgi:hypothetical protein
MQSLTGNGINSGWGDTVVVIAGLPDMVAGGPCGKFRFELEKGGWFFGPFQKLVQNSIRKLRIHIEISPFGLHWPDLDEDLSFHGLLEGNRGQFQKKVKV